MRERDEPAARPTFTRFVIDTDALAEAVRDITEESGIETAAPAPLARSTGRRD